MKIFGKLLLLICGISIFYFLLMQVDWKAVFEFEKNHDRLEAKLGKLVLDHVKETYEVIDDEQLNSTLDSIFKPILKENYISDKNYDLYLIKSEEVNAFALPDDKIIVTTGLITFLDSSNYLSAILAHEIAHCEKNHVMRALITNFGLDLLLSGSGTGEITNFVTGQAYSRKLEKEADELAVDYLEQAKINPNSIAQVMELFDVYLTSDGDVSWISSHPAPADRKKYLLQKINRLNSEDQLYKNPIHTKTWTGFQNKVTALDNEHSLLDE